MPEIVKVVPSVIQSDGMISITVMGSQFPEADCFFRIGGLVVTSICISNSQIEYHGPINIPMGYASLEISFNSVEFFSSSNFIMAVGLISVWSISPSTVSTDGGALITAHGSNFSASANISCVFGNKQKSVPTIVSSSSTLTCKAPATGVGSSFVRLSIFASELLPFSAPIRFVNHPLLLFVIPSIGSELGGTIVTLQGEQFFNDIGLHCVVDGLRVSAKVISESVATCVTPYVGINHTGTISLEASALLYQDGNQIPFSFFKFPENIEISPSSGPSRGGFDVFISGWNFPVESSVCRYGHVLSPMKLFGPHKVCESPQLDAGLYDLALSPNGCDFLHGVPFRVLPKAEFVRVSPSSASEIGGHLITLSGIVAQAFDEVICKFDSEIKNGSSIGRILSADIICALPTLPASKYAISLQINGLVIEFDQVFIDVTPSIVLESLHPSAAFRSGGSFITARGLHLNSSRLLYCHFGRAAPMAFVARTQFEGSCATPVHEIGSVDFRIATIDQNDGSRVTDFLFVLEPVIFSVVPSSVMQFQVVVLNVSGANFADYGGLHCFYGFNMSGSGKGVLRSSTFLQCTVSFTECGVFEFSLSLNGKDVLQTGLTITVIPSETVHRVIPSFGSHVGGTSVSIFGSNFRFSSNVFIKFGEEACH